MNSLLNRLSGWLFAKPPSLICDAEVWRSGAAELRRRTLNGRREAGAFLLGTRKGPQRRIEAFAFYDDIDPHALDSGIVHFNGNKFGRVWEICREQSRSVVADVHVHPGRYEQSASDQDEPAIPRAGHIAIIIPHFAQRAVEPSGIGLYEYLGNKRWCTHTASGSKFFRLIES